MAESDNVDLQTVLMKGKATELPLSALLDNPVQPAGRTEGKNLYALKKAVKQSNYIAPIIVVPHNTKDNYFTKCDGHRRCAVAAALGIRKVPCIVLPKGTDAVAMFQLLDKAMMSFSGNQWFQVWSKDPKSTEIPAVQRKNIEQIIGWVGVENAHQLAKQGVAPSIAGMVTRILSIQTAHPRLISPMLKGAEILTWVMNDNWRDVRHFISKKYAGSARPEEAAKLLFRTIRAGVKLP